MNVSLKSVSNTIYLIGFACALLLITHKTFGYASAIRIGFYIFGAVGLILNFLAARNESFKGDFNILFWIGSLIVYIGLIAKTNDLRHFELVIIGGMAITGLSYFYNPMNNSGDKNDDLLDG